jgi:hypothetical protein
VPAGLVVTSGGSLSPFTLQARYSISTQNWPASAGANGRAFRGKSAAVAGSQQATAAKTAKPVNRKIDITSEKKRFIVAAPG